MSNLWYKCKAPKFESKKSKSLIHTFAIGNYAGLSINPYQGCQHRCAYCYATYQWSPEFYDKIYAKNNAHEVLEKQLAAWKADTIDPVMVGSATDAYQPAELRFNLTRRCIKVLQKHNVPYYIFTKSTIIDRDFELHCRYKHNCFIIWSVTTCNEKIRRIMEPGTPPAEKIFATIHKFIEAGICCGVNIDPIIPLVTDGDDAIDTILDNCKAAGLRYIFGALLRLRGDIWERMKLVIKLLEIPDGVDKYRRIYHFQESSLLNYVAADRRYADLILGKLEQKIKMYGMTYGFPAHIKPKNINKSPLMQTTLLDYLI